MNIDLKFNKDCNWDCDYCNQDKKNSKHISEDAFIIWLKENINYLFKAVPKPTLEFSGGEPGLWSSRLWNEIWKIIETSCLPTVKIRIFSNGSIFENKEVLSFIQSKNNIEIIWHVAPHIGKAIKLPESLNNEITNNIKLMAVLSKKDIENIPIFFELNPWISNIHFDPVQVSHSVKLPKTERFDLDDYKNLLSMCLKYESKISKNSLDEIMFSYSALKNNRLDMLRNVCYNQRVSIIIDVSEGVFYKCCNFSDTLPYSKKMLLNLVTNKSLFPKESCNTCVHETFFYLEHLANGNSLFNHK